ncbi:MAG: HAMP domain-containing sensor histidine kinase [Candidatus Margulisbacteria bacterium]|nr:HAMP domain-containing sensor histidine kinase [Candidatus Margulisiibacteriota bacterium]
MTNKIKVFSFRFKFFLIITLFFLFFLASAVVLFNNFQKDRQIDSKLAFYAYNANAVQNIYTSFSKLFYLSYKHSDSVTYEARRDFIHLINSLDYQFHNFLRSSNQYGSSYVGVMQKEYEFYIKTKDLIQILFEKKISQAERQAIVRQLNFLEDSVLSELHRITNENYADVSFVFRQRTLSYERFLVFYIGALIFFVIFGFGSLIYFYVKNFSSPYKKFLASIDSVKNGIFEKTIDVNSNKEFNELADAFNGMMQRLFEIDKQLKEHIDNIEDIVEAKTKELEDKNKQLMELDELKDQFLQNISHELRTPLTSILGYIEIVLNYGNIPKTQETFLRIAHENSLSLLKIINKLLLLNEVESGNTRLNLQMVDVSVLINDTVKKIMIQADKKKLKLNVNIIKGKSVKDLLVEVDIDNMESVFSNLLSNAIKFTEKGQIDVNVTGGKDKIVVEIKDSGIGIKKEDLKIIFDKFRQVDNSLTKIYDGTGLGLSIVKNIIELHGADISVDSVLGKGTTFTVTLYKKH